MPTPFSAPRPSTVGFSSLYLGIILIGANLRAPITSLGPVLPAIQNELHLSGTTAGLLNSLPLLIFALLSLVAPAVGRLHGLERILGVSVMAILVGTVTRSLDLPGSIWFALSSSVLGSLLGMFSSRVW